MSLTAQQIFDRVATHLLKQNQKSLSAKGTCAYRGVGGLMCAVGCLIPIDRYVPRMEGRTVHSIFCLDPGFTTDEEGRQLLLDLQILHDESPVRHWRDRLSQVAALYELDDSCVRFVGSGIHRRLRPTEPAIAS